MTKRPIPKHLQGAGRTMWHRLRGDYAIDDAAGLALLEAACAAYQRAEAARAQVDREGSTVPDRFGQMRAHPAVAIERDARSVMIRALRALKLSPEAT